MSSRIANVLRVCRVQLANSGFYSPGLVDYLYSNGCINAEDKEQVNCDGLTHQDRSRKLMDILSLKPDYVLDSVLSYFQTDRTQSHLENFLCEAAREHGYDQRVGLPGTAANKSLASASKSIADGPAKVLPHKWWPRQKVKLISFVERVGEDGLPLVCQLRKQLTSPEGRLTVITANKQVICGMGGIGKTSTAIWYAHTYEEEYDYILWIDSEGATLNTSFQSLAEDLTPQVRQVSGRSIDQLAGKIYNKFIEACCLFIFDNAQGYGEPDGLKLSLLPTGETHHVIITSRYHKWGNSLEHGPIAPLRLNLFSETECVAFLYKALPQLEKYTDSDGEDLVELGKELGFLPLAPSCAAATISNTSRHTVASYLAEIRKDLSELTESSVLDEYERSVSATLRLSISQIQKEERILVKCRECCINILNVAALCEPHSIQEKLFHGLPNMTPELVSDAIDQLILYSLLLVEKKEAEENVSLGMHRLLQNAVRFGVITDVDNNGGGCEVAKLALECMQRQLNKFSTSHAFHAWKILSSCKGLNAIQRDFHQFPYLVSLTNSYDIPTLKEFLLVVSENLTQVFVNSWDLPRVQIKLCLIELQIDEIQRKFQGTSKRRHEVELAYNELVNAVQSSDVPHRAQLLLHLRIVGLSVKQVLSAAQAPPNTGNESVEEIELYKKALDDMRELGYSGILQGIELHYFDRQWLGKTTGLRLHILMGYVTRFCSLDQASVAFTTFQQEMEIEGPEMDIDSIWRILLILMYNYQYWSQLRAKVLPILGKLQQTKLAAGIDPICVVLHSNNNTERICKKLNRFTDPYIRLLRMQKMKTGHISQDTLADVLVTLRFLTLPLQQWSLSDAISFGVVLDAILDIVWEMYSTQYEEWITSDNIVGNAHSVASVVDLVWAGFVSAAEQQRFLDSASPMKRLSSINALYSRLLTAAQRGAEIVDVDKITKEILAKWRPSLKSHLSPLFYTSRNLCDFGFVQQVDKWPTTPEERRTILESKLSLILYFIKDYKQRIRYIEYPPDNLSYMCDVACFLHLCLDRTELAADAWSDLVEVLNKPELLALATKICIRSNTLAYLETKEDQWSRDMLHSFIATIANTMQNFLPGQKILLWAKDPQLKQLNSLLVRVTTHGHYALSAELIKIIEIPDEWLFPRNKLKLSALKELVPELLNLSIQELDDDDADGDKNKNQTLILSKLNTIHMMSDERS